MLILWPRDALIRYESTLACTIIGTFNHSIWEGDPVTFALPFRSFFALAPLVLLVSLSYPSTSAQDPSSVQNHPYEKWLDEDVRWIISDSETADFKKLWTNEQRDRFVTAFWDRRNPLPGSTTNTFKEEHYRRLAYVNQHFAEGIPGWKTDRGRFYILYGPPDKVIRHSIAGETRQINGSHKTAFNSEEWRWKYIEGLGCNVIFEFDDRSGSGEYHLTRAENGVGRQENGVTPLRQLGPDCLIDQILFP
jgi:GWxTD domain-containing protein